MLKADYHLHTRLSYDGQGDLLEYCARAEELGLDELCVTEHLDIGCAQMEFTPHEQKIYLEQFEKARGQFPGLEMRFGMEIGFRPDTHVESAMFISALPLDFVINSIHEINDMDPYFGGYFEGKSRSRSASCACCTSNSPVFGVVMFTSPFWSPWSAVRWAAVAVAVRLPCMIAADFCAVNRAVFVPQSPFRGDVGKFFCTKFRGVFCANRCGWGTIGGILA